MVEKIISFISSNWLSVVNTIVLVFGVRWYEKRLQKSLSKELEFYKSELNKDIEKYKTELNVIYDRKLSFSKNEIETLKELWSYFIESFYKFNSSCGIYTRHTDISMMSDQELEEYFTEKDFFLNVKRIKL